VVFWAVHIRSSRAPRQYYEPVLETDPFNAPQHFTLAQAGVHAPMIRRVISASSGSQSASSSHSSSRLARADPPIASRRPKIFLAEAGRLQMKLAIRRGRLCRICLNLEQPAIDARTLPFAFNIVSRFL